MQKAGFLMTRLILPLHVVMCGQPGDVFVFMPFQLVPFSSRTEKLFHWYIFACDSVNDTFLIQIRSVKLTRLCLPARESHFPLP